MRITGIVALCASALLTACSSPRPPANRDRPPRPSAVTLAALQIQSRMGDVDGNLARIERLVRAASGRGAQVCVLPECAVCGYADLAHDIFWSIDGDDEGYLDVRRVAQPVPGPATDRLSALADELDIYLTIPLIESARVDGEDRFFNTVALASPDGRIVETYRKRVTWTVADTWWMTEGPERVAIADTEYGRLGLMICRDVHLVLAELGAAGADIVLDCVAWYGPNSGGWFETKLAWMIQEADVDFVLANWSFDDDPGWSGFGLSRIIGRDGKRIAGCSSDLGDEAVIATIPVRSKRDGPAAPTK